MSQFDQTTLFKASYGLYVLIASQEGQSYRKDNGSIINTFLQVTSAPPFIGVISVNKTGYTHDMIMATRRFNLSILSTAATFDTIKQFGFVSGRDTNKFGDEANMAYAPNGIPYITGGQANGYLCCKVLDTMDFDTHTVFKVEVIDGKHLSDDPSLTYAYYQAHTKPQPAAEASDAQGYRCTICNYVYEGTTLPPDFTCPICKHGASDFEKI